MEAGLREENEYDITRYTVTTCRNLETKEEIKVEHAALRKRGQVKILVSGRSDESVT
jgi:hypothetical protein